ncbi:Uncharacterised protein r2_g3482 [Pycnogonum litorale]
MNIEMEALQQIIQLKLENVIILTDSKAALQHLQRWSNPTPTQNLISTLRDSLVKLQWIPSHCDIPENEVADHLAKTASLMGPKPNPQTATTNITKLKENAYMSQ